MNKATRTVAAWQADKASHRLGTPWKATGKVVQDAEGQVVAMAESVADAQLMAQAPRLAAILSLVVGWQKHGADGPIETWIGRAGLGIWDDAIETLRNAGEWVMTAPIQKSGR